MSTLSITPLLYGPTPLHMDQGEHAFFSMQVSADPSVSYASVTATVQLFDGNANLVRTIEAPVKLGAGGSAKVSVPWDGKDNQGNLLPPGDYAPTFVVTGVRNA